MQKNKIYEKIIVFFLCSQKLQTITANRPNGRSNKNIIYEFSKFKRFSFWDCNSNST